jgi:hypothetical protein
MISIFRKIRRSLMDNGNTSKYLKYAIGEIFLVVLGILLALQINNWNENRIYINQRNYLLSELIAEFEGNLTELKRCNFLNKSYVGKNDSILELLPSLHFPGDETKLSKALVGPDITNISTYNPSTGLINSMQNTSNFQQIKDADLRRSLLNWSGYLDDYKENESLYLDYRMNLFEYLTPFIMISMDVKFENFSQYSGLKIENTLELRNKLYQNRLMKFAVVTEGDELIEKVKMIIEQLKTEIKKW